MHGQPPVMYEEVNGVPKLRYAGRDGIVFLDLNEELRLACTSSFSENLTPITENRWFISLWIVLEMTPLQY